MAAIIGRRGERIIPADYPAYLWARVGERLDALAAERDDENAEVQS